MRQISFNFDQVLRLLTIIGAVASFFWGVWVWKNNSDKELRQQELEALRLSESRRVEATKPFLDKQLKLYAEASQMAALIATSDDPQERGKALSRFWQLFWGELALVENREVEKAMVALGKAIKKNAPQNELEDLSLELAHACRRSLDKSWGINAWTMPDDPGIPLVSPKQPM